MSQPAGPPPYDAIYTHGVQTHPVQVQPRPQVVYVVDSQSHVMHPGPGFGGGSVFGGIPNVVVCSTCNQMVRTTTIMSPALRTHMCALLLCVCGLWPCCPLPYCMPSCNNVDHFCPNCNTLLGSYQG